MESSNIFYLLVCFNLALRIPELTSAQFSFRHSWCGDATYAPNSTYQSNLRAVLNSLATDTRITYGFYNFTVGQGPDRVNSLVICRGDVPVGTCRVCVRDSASSIPHTCPNQKEAFGYSQYCKIFVSNRAIYGIVQNDPQWYLTTSDNVTGVTGFNQTLYSLMSSLQNRAASGNSELKYATGEVSLTGGGGQKLYGLVQCTPDLSRLACIQCIQGSLSVLPTCCIQPSYTASGVTIVIPSCFVQYELFNFTGNVPNLTPPPLPPSPGPPSPPNNDTSTSAVRRRKKSLNPSVIAVPIVGTTIMIVAVVLCITLRKKKMRKSWMLKFNKDEIETLQSLQFSLGTIKQATGDFSEENKLGEGGFGVVYKGVLSDGQELAVKRLSKNSAHGDLQFKNEILILAILQHKNLVRLLGFCLQEEEMLLIYEFVANRSLDYFIFNPVQRETMRWETRYKIIYGIARGLLYLHEESRTRIIHRDLKAGNVLLDEEFNPKIADFGMARLFNIDQTQTLASRIVGTYGYMSPEYVLHGQVSMKTDVFSFGVLVLEIVSGQRISSFLNGENPESLLSYAWRNWVDGTPWNVVDTTLSAGFSTDILRCIHIGLLCVQENPVDRPAMSSIDLMLSRQSLTLQVPLQPAFFVESISQSNGPSQENTTTESSSRTRRYSVNEVTITEPYPRYYTMDFLTLLVLQFVFISLIPKISAQYQFLHSRCGNTSYYTPNSTYQSNLKTVLNSLSTTRVTNGYYNLTTGQKPDKVEAMVLCRGDVPVNNCRLCMRNSAASLPLFCPNQTQAFGYSDPCIIFYSNNATSHVVRDRPLWGLWNNKNVSDIIGFNNTLTALMKNLQNQASLGNSELKFAAGQTNLSGTNKTMYGLVQCSPDLSSHDCVVCIQGLFSFFPKWFVTPTFTAAGARLITPSCNLRYEIYSFYGNVTDVGPPSSPPPLLPPSSVSNRSTTAKVEERKRSYSTIFIVLPILGSLVLIIIIASISFLLRRKKLKRSTTKINKEEIETLQSLQYSIGTIKVATDDFSDNNYLGEGGFGTVYKGKLPDHQEIAVKRLARNSVQGDLQFKNEILILAKLQHRNLVRLLGFCLEEDEMLLIYEFVTNKSLDNFLFEPMQGKSMPWETRYKVINGVARGLLYLHEDSRLRIIHRDLKAGNVLLDVEFNPKIADFGMARLFNIDQTQAVASRIVGTYGYMAPEYVLHGHVSMKSDVFSFGVLILEIVSGQRISSFQIGENPENLLTFAWKNWLEGKAWNLVDPTLFPAFSTEILRCIHIGLLCVQHNMADRPTMSSVELMLSSSSVSLQVPSQPAFFTRSHTISNATSQGTSGQSTSRMSACSINEVSMTEIYPR
ncbi:uncharacterized protein LOC110687158 [Chenopodium quinoa]|uniref:uncharacterized protein LOC110687158 n=1 Tax=Chenopodium quinoa TaxID=63459 RepID=UPI000B78C217|nr:uncharacterized protein LOC110687158 [Chenopodium quinoa]